VTGSGAGRRNQPTRRRGAIACSSAAVTTYLSDNFVNYLSQQILSRWPQPAATRLAGSDSGLPHLRRRPTRPDWGTGHMTTPLYQLKAEFFKTLGHPARIRILELLAQRPHSVGELLTEVGIEGSHMSQQLAVLRRAGVVVASKRGNTVIYSMASPDLAELLAVARTVLTGLLNDQVSMLKDLKASARAAARTTG